jgi:ATP-dependent DNA helicase RecG
MKETQHIEWKETWRDEYLRWICGFANANGGVLHIGRNRQGIIVGVSNADRLMEDIPNKVRDILGILVEVNLREKAGKEYLEIAVEPYPYPVSYKGEYHLRSGSTKQELKGAVLDKFLLRKQGRHWDGIPMPNFKIADLSALALMNFRKKSAKSQRLSAELIGISDAGIKYHLDKLKTLGCIRHVGPTKTGRWEIIR